MRKKTNRRITMRTPKYSRLMMGIAVILTMFSHPSPVMACSCVADVPIPTEFSQSDAVFIGSSVRIVDNYVPILSTLDSLLYKSGSSPYFFDKGWKSSGFTIFFKVTTSWKGVEKSLISVSTGRGGGDCGYPFQADQEYLVYANHAYGNPNKYLVTSICSRTTEIPNASEDLNYLQSRPTKTLKFSSPFLWTVKDLEIAASFLIFGIILVSRQLSKSKRKSKSNH
jgi:hypothetical protein